MCGLEVRGLGLEFTGLDLFLLAATLRGTTGPAGGGDAPASEDDPASLTCTITQNANVSDPHQFIYEEGLAALKRYDDEPASEDEQAKIACAPNGDFPRSISPQKLPTFPLKYF